VAVFWLRILVRGRVWLWQLVSLGARKDYQVARRRDATITLFAQGKWLAILDAGFQRAQGKQDPQPRPWTLLCLCEIPKTCTAPMPTSSA